MLIPLNRQESYLMTINKGGLYIILVPDMLKINVTFFNLLTNSNFCTGPNRKIMQTTIQTLIINVEDGALM